MVHIFIFVFNHISFYETYSCKTYLIICLYPEFCLLISSRMLHKVSPHIILAQLQRFLYAITFHLHTTFTFSPQLTVSSFLLSPYFYFFLSQPICIHSYHVSKPSQISIFLFFHHSFLFLASLGHPYLRSFA